jgi:hypothetical protein
VFTPGPAPAERYAKGMEKGEYTVEEGFGDVSLSS